MEQHAEADGAANSAPGPGKTQQPESENCKSPTKSGPTVQGAELGQRPALLAVLASKSPGPRFGVPEH